MHIIPIYCIHTHVEGGDNSEGETERFSLNLTLPNLTASQVIDSLSDWDGMDNIIAPFRDLVVAESGEI